MTSTPFATQLTPSSPAMDRWLAAWRTPSWRRRLAGWALVGALGDAVTTSMLSVVGGVHEGNPVVAAGIGVVGSAPLFMAIITIPLAIAVSFIAVPPLTSAGRSALRMLAIAGLIKLGATVWNVVLIDSAIRAAAIIVI